MCLSPLVNNRLESEAYKKGIKYYDCGACPECLSKRANSLVLRAVAEAKVHRNNCMCTLTYDQFVRDCSGRIIGEEVATNPVNKADVQKFIKRVRDYFNYPDMKYLVSAEYGKHTGRPHYHILFFGINFCDSVFYKKSKRGNVIMQSHTLNKLWKHGICTVDSNHINAAKARYCTKYCIKDSRTSDTFSLMSHHLGREWLLKKFNGLYYMLEGRQYPIPRFVWESVISDTYPHLAREFTTKYLNAPLVDKNDPSSRISRGSLAITMRNDQRRAMYRSLRDSTPAYQRYLVFWQKKSLIIDRSFKSIPKRILLLDDRKYHNYKEAAMKAFSRRIQSKPIIPPRSNCIASYYHYLSVMRIPVGICPTPSRHNRANDSLKRVQRDNLIELIHFGNISEEVFLKKEQISFEKVLT